MSLSPLLQGRAKGFTLLEVMVGLIVGTIVAGGVMGLISVSLQYKQRLKEKSRIQPVLEAVAQAILADPRQAAEGNLNLSALKDAPPVDISVVRVAEGQQSGSNRMDQLYRVLLACKGQMLEFSVIIPRSEFQ
jgi:prepilin-type N-terminal cleavage/methylation domain-containing protein